MFILTVNGVRAGMIHLVGKRQETYKISPLILAQQYRGKAGLGSRLLSFAEDYAVRNGARQIYCTVAEENTSALQFFLRKGYLPAGRSASHYKEGITEVMLYSFGPRESTMRDSTARIFPSFRARSIISRKLRKSCSRFSLSIFAVLTRVG